MAKSPNTGCCVILRSAATKDLSSMSRSAAAESHPYARL